MTDAPPFAAFVGDVQPQSGARAAVTAAYRRAEPDCVRDLLPEATLSAAELAQARALAHRLVTALRAKGTRGPVEGLVREYALSSQEGVALMCLAEALLRIPDIPTRDALIRDKIGRGDWHAHLGHSRSLFVNAATWGLLLTGRLVATSSEAGLSAALTRLIARGGEPLIRRGVDLAMRMMGEQFVAGQTIEEALVHARRMEARGFRYSYDMLGEAATTAADAARYWRAYEHAIHTIGHAAAGRGIIDGPGISVKLSALHPRYGRAQRDRVMRELLPALQKLTHLAKHYDIGLNIDAEEADRLDISLDLLEALCADPVLAGWGGIGFVVQAYQRRAAAVLDAVIDLARRSGHRLMVRLVKGAYWDSEIKRAQVDGLEDFPVFTRKLHTDVSYLACARKLLAAPRCDLPQVRDAQRLYARGDPQHGGRRLPQRPVRVPVPAWHGRAALRRSCRCQQARSPVPHLCAGRHARDAARLSRPPAAGERCQHVVRQPYQRSGRADRGAHRRSGDRGRVDRASRCAASADRVAAPPVRRGARQFDGARPVERADAGDAGRRADGECGACVECLARRCRDGGGASGRQSRRSSRHRRTCDRSRRGAGRYAPLVRRSRRRRAGPRWHRASAPRACCGPPICWKRGCRCCSG